MKAWPERFESVRKAASLAVLEGTEKALQWWRLGYANSHGHIHRHAGAGQGSRVQDLYHSEWRRNTGCHHLLHQIRRFSRMGF